ncbi:hypothetical protein [Pyxidicoccus caerfyrddinensis]|uniref:hypothetical protein n=1 Tax=Pyxidicoccus caerfyrddinensis TaxID=2709663 RepID=UPI001F08374E|nr:hypothetical protein [Pyxidicoccus caerfyrddinensis]
MRVLHLVEGERQVRPAVAAASAASPSSRVAPASRVPRSRSARSNTGGVTPTVATPPTAPSYSRRAATPSWS